MDMKFNKNRVVLGLATAAVILVLIFVMQNTVGVEFNFFFWGGNAPLSVVIIVTFVLGLLSGILYEKVAAHRRKKREEEMQAMRNTISKFAQENLNLKKQNKDGEAS